MSLFAFFVIMALIGGADAQQPQRVREATKVDPVPRDVQDFVLFAQSRPLIIRSHVFIDGKPYGAVWSDYVLKVHEFLDANADGTVTKVELERMPPMALLTGLAIVGGRAPLNVPVESVDVNKDGSVSREEIASYLRANGAAPFQFQMGGSPSMSGARVISLAEQASVTPAAANEAIFALLDKNKDGNLSREELSAAPTAFLSKDIDDDELITPQELAPIVVQPQQRVIASRPGTQSPNPADNAVMLLGSREAALELSRQLLLRYGAKNEPPENRTLNVTDIGLDDAEFRRLDADGSGSLDNTELQAFAHRQPDVELTFRLGKRSAGEPEIDGRIIKAGSEKVSLTKTTDGSMQLSLGMTRIILRTGAVSANSNIRLPVRLKDQYLNQFKAADADSNGYLDSNEASGSPIFRTLFKALDADGDGMLFEKEVVAYLDRVEGLQRAVNAGCVTLSLANRGSGLFDYLDSDKDGRLSIRELRQAAELAARLDHDRDQQLARREIPRNYEMRIRSGPAGTSNELNGVVVVDRRSLGDMALPPARDGGPLWFRKMDANRDGDLSRREFLGSDADFRRFDADADGLISAQEAERGDAAVRQKAGPHRVR